MTTRSNPFEELERLFERMSRQFDDATPAWDAEGPFGGWRAGRESMSIDLAETDGEFVVTADLPGFDSDDVDIRVTDHTLQVEAEREEATKEHEAEYLRRERRHESVRRSIRLPDDVDRDAVTATMKHGVLTVTLPRLAAEDARSIDIE